MGISNVDDNKPMYIKYSSYKKKGKRNKNVRIGITLSISVDQPESQYTIIYTNVMNLCKVANMLKLKKKCEPTFSSRRRLCYCIGLCSGVRRIVERQGSSKES